MIDVRAKKLIKDFEGCRLTSYQDSGGVWTIGWGHTSKSVKANQTITQHQADEILESDIGLVEEAVSKMAPMANQNQFSALVSLAFNVGVGALAGSKLLKRFIAGGPLAAANEFVWFEPDGTPHGWVHDDGRVIPGLVRRRVAEKALFLEVPS